jgi:glycine hydroxymethyltransferase
MILSNNGLAGTIDKSVFPRTQGGPFMHLIAAKAVAFGEAMRPEFKEYQTAVVNNAQVLANQLQELGFRIVSGGTDTHLMLVDVSPAGITGKQAEEALDSVNITANKNTIPYDPRPPRVTSGLRLGTPAVTSRGFGPEEMAIIARLMHRTITNLDDERVKEEVRDEVSEVTSRFPVPGIDY